MEPQAGSSLVQGETKNPDPLLSPAEAGAYLGTGERFVRRLIAERRKRDQYAKVGKFVKLRQSTLERWIDDNTVEPD